MESIGWSLLEQLQLTCSVFPLHGACGWQLWRLCIHRSSVLGQRNRGWKVTNTTNTTNPKKSNWGPELDAAPTSWNVWSWLSMHRVENHFKTRRHENAWSRSLQMPELIWFPKAKAIRPWNPDVESIHHWQAYMIEMEDGQVWLQCGESSSFIFGSPVAVCVHCSWIQKNPSWSHSVYILT